MTLEITTDGKIYLDDKEKKQWYNKGYKMVWLQGKNVYVHRLVATEHIPNPNNYPCINHINGLKDDNRIENLEWCTVKMNRDHAKLLGLLQNIVHNNHFNEQQVEEIKAKYIQGKYGYRKLAKDYSVTNSTIKSIIKEQTYNKSYIKY
jgi:hypothetical protein